jgi:hypothetical protein
MHLFSLSHSQDTDRMSASTLAAMAEAVEKSACVVMLVASQYKQSEACRTEGEYRQLSYLVHSGKSNQ